MRRACERCLRTTSHREANERFAKTIQDLGFANTSICPKLKPKVALSSSTREQCQRKQICPLALLLGSAPTLPSPAADCAHHSERTHGQTHRWRTISIVDLRQPMDIEAFPQMIPGALRIAMEEIEERHGEIPRDRDVVLYCS